MKMAIAVLPCSGAGEDRAIAIATAKGCLVAVADGAGGSGDGAAAAESLTAFVANLAAETHATDWCAALRTFDRDLSAHPSGGQTTGVLVFIGGDRISGAAVGDSAAWLLRAGEVVELTEPQHRKPLLGSGATVPVRFECQYCNARLLVESDGLVKYASRDKIHTLGMTGSVEAAVDALSSCVRLPSGGLQDDVAVVIVER
jgi:serine/threonine protein phosphatase PrpC